MVFGARRRHHPRRQGIDRNALLAQLFCHHPGHAHHRAFGRDIGHLPRVGEKVGARGDVDDAAVRTAFEQRVDRPGNIEIAEVVDLHEAVHLFIGQLMPGRAAREDAGVVDQNIHLMVTAGDGLDGCGDLAFVGDITELSLGLAAGGANRLGGFCRVSDIEDFDLRPFGGQPQCRRAAEPGGCAGDHRYPILQTSHRFFLS
jgi:hypothetical protein